MASIILNWDGCYSWRLNVIQVDNGLAIHDLDGREFFVAGKNIAQMFAEAISCCIALISDEAERKSNPADRNVKTAWLLGGLWEGSVIIFAKRDRVCIELISYEGSNGWSELPPQQAIELQEFLLDLGKRPFTV